MEIDCIVLLGQSTFGDTRVLHNAFIVAEYIRRPINWNSKHFQLVPQSLDLFSRNAKAHKLAPKGTSFHHILLLAVLQNQCVVKENQNPRMTASHNQVTRMRSIQKSTDLSQLTPWLWHRERKHNFYSAYPLQHTMS